MVDFNKTKDGIEYCFGDFIVSSGWDGGGCPTYNKDTRDRYIIMQFTGLRDLKGVDIYEGDILRNTHGAEGQVYFNKTIYIAQEMTERRFSSEVEIIGNIHTDKHLLE